MSTYVSTGGWFFVDIEILTQTYLHEELASFASSKLCLRWIKECHAGPSGMEALLMEAAWVPVRQNDTALHYHTQVMTPGMEHCESPFIKL